MIKSTQKQIKIPPLRLVREAQGLSLRHVARRSGIDPAHLSRIERGHVRPSLRTLLSIAHELQLKELARLLAQYDLVNDRGESAAEFTRGMRGKPLQNQASKGLSSAKGRARERTRATSPRRK